MKIIITIVVLVTVLVSCSSVKEYDKQYINDPDMKLSARGSERYETTFQVYRDASISLFSNFSEADLLKLGTASKASVSVRGIGYCILGHELHHKHIIIERYL
jgi:hypothetical protein